MEMQLLAERVGGPVPIPREVRDRAGALVRLTGLRVPSGLGQVNMLVAVLHAFSDLDFWQGCFSLAHVCTSG